MYKEKKHMTDVPISPTPDAARRAPIAEQQSVPSQSQISSPPAPPMQSSTPPVPQEEKHGISGMLKLLLALIVVVLVFGSFAFLAVHFIENKTNEKVTLTYWGLWEDSNIMQAIISDFERVNPNISVVYTKEDPKQYTQRLLTRSANGTGPDIFRFHNSWVPMLSGILTPLPNTVMTPQEFTKTFYPVAQRDLIKNGAIVGVPLEIDTLALFINTQLFQAEKLSTPTTWPDFITVSKALTVRDTNGKIKTAGAAMGTYDNITHAPDIISLLFAQNGVNLTDISTTQQNAQDALTFYTSFALPDGNVWDTTLNPSMQAFANGNLAMYFGYSWDVFSIQALNQNLTFSINPVPHLPGRNMTIASYWVEGISNKSKHQKEAMLFMKFLAQKDTVQKLYTQETKTRPFGEPYARTDLASSLANTPAAPFIAQAPNATSTYFSGETQDDGINGQLNAYLGNAVRSILGNSSVQTALDTLTKGFSQVLGQYASSTTKK